MNDAVDVRHLQTLVLTFSHRICFLSFSLCVFCVTFLDKFLFRLNSTNFSMDPNQEITAGRRLPSISKDEWKRQTTVDARNVLQTHHSIDQTLSSNDSRTEKRTKTKIRKIRKFSSLFFFRYKTSIVSESCSSSGNFPIVERSFS